MLASNGITWMHKNFQNSSTNRLSQCSKPIIIKVTKVYQQGDVVGRERANNWHSLLTIFHQLNGASQNGFSICSPHVFVMYVIIINHLFIKNIYFAPVNVTIL